MTDEKTVFVIPVRGGSRRLPRKNLLELDGETLLARKIRQVSYLGMVIVGSDDDEMLKEAERCGAKTVRRECVDEAGGDTANDMIAEMMIRISHLVNPWDTVVWCHVTNPLVSMRTYHAALCEYQRALKAGYDSLVSVHEIRNHYWTQDGQPLYDVDRCRVHHMCAAELTPIYEQDGACFIQSYDRFMETCYFFGERPFLFKIPEDEFLDINVERDYILAKAIIER